MAANGVEDLLGDTNGFLAKVFTALESDGIDVSNYLCDHVCYRVETLDIYTELKQNLLEFGELLSEAQIGGRPICTFKLDAAIEFGNKIIPCLELPSPKEGRPYNEGYEHIELVIDKSFEEFMSMYPNVQFETKSISKEINPDIMLRYDGLSVKFHHNDLEYVIRCLQ